MNNNNIILKYTKLLLYKINSKDVDWRYAEILILKIFEELGCYQLEYLEIYIKILVNLKKYKKALSICSIYLNIDFKLYIKNYVFICISMNNIEDIVFALKDIDYIDELNLLSDYFFKNSNRSMQNDFFNLIKKSNIIYNLPSSYYKTLYFWANYTNNFYAADDIFSIYNVFQNKNCTFEKPPYRLDRSLLFKQYQDSLDYPLVIVFSAFESAIVNKHYKKYGIKNLDKLYGSREFQFTNFFNGQNICNTLHMLDEFQLYFFLYFDDYITSINNFLDFYKNSCKNNFKLITFGSSSGGFAALLFGNLLNADLAIACSPQTIAFYDYVNKYREELCDELNIKFNKLCYLNRVINFSNNDKTKYILYTSSQNEIDLFHVNFFEENFSKDKTKLEVKKFLAGPDHSLFNSLGIDVMKKYIYSDISKC